jgi:hypothetical protein
MTFNIVTLNTFVVSGLLLALVLFVVLAASEFTRKRMVGHTDAGPAAHMLLFIASMLFVGLISYVKGHSTSMHSVLSKMSDRGLCERVVDQDSGATVAYKFVFPLENKTELATESKIIAEPKTPEAQP